MPATTKQTPDPSVLFTCLQDASSIPSTSASDILHTPDDTDYSALLYFTMQNLRFSSSATITKPFVIITPQTEPEISASILCCKKNGFQVRIRSGGHDYEGLSYASKTPFVILDLLNFKNIEIDEEGDTAWVGAGSTLGEVYFRIAETSSTLGFPGGVCSTVGLSGLVAGGGTGAMSRKYGLSSDYLMDARIVDVNGRVLDRESMGEDLFWALRGGGGNCFGVVTALKIKLVPVPETVTVFDVSTKTTAGQSEVLLLLDRWQQSIITLPDDVFIRAAILPRKVNKNEKGIVLKFSSLFLGSATELVQLMTERFPELGLKIEDCEEMSWIESVVYFNRFPRGTPTSVLLDRGYKNKRYFKAKCDIVKAPIPPSAWQGLFEIITKHERISIMMDPHGGKMSGVLEHEFPFPHRYDDIYHIKYTATWSDTAEEKCKIDWLREVYAYMAPYVTQNPRGAYINYRDLDVGMDESGNSSYEYSLEWGLKYFKGNYKRLALIKGRVDPDNFFRNEQSVFPLFE